MPNGIYNFKSKSQSFYHTCSEVNFLRYYFENFPCKEGANNIIIIVIIIIIYCFNIKKRVFTEKQYTGIKGSLQILIHQSKNLQPLRPSTTLKISQYWTATSLVDSPFPLLAQRQGQLNCLRFSISRILCNCFLLKIHDNLCFYYFSALMDSTLLSIREATKQQLQYWGACCPGALAHSHRHQCTWIYFKVSETWQDSAVTGRPFVVWFFTHRLSSRQLISYFYQFISNYTYLLTSFSPLICILESFMSEMDQKLAFGGGIFQFPQSVKHHRHKEEWQQSASLQSGRYS